MVMAVLGPAIDTSRDQRVVETDGRDNPRVEPGDMARP